MLPGAINVIDLLFSPAGIVFLPQYPPAYKESDEDPFSTNTDIFFENYTTIKINCNILNNKKYYYIRYFF
jgi:hypothetical protein